MGASALEVYLAALFNKLFNKLSLTTSLAGCACAIGGKAYKDRLMPYFLRWKVNYPPSQLVGLGFEPHWRPQPAKLPSFGGYSLETLCHISSEARAM